MFCINCGVKLETNQKKCPLCNTPVYHPDFKYEPSGVLYPPDRKPALKAKPKAFNGAVIILFFIPLLVTFLADMQTDKTLDWFGFVAGAILLSYITVALPLWFTKPNPVIFVPCDFAAAALYLLYINIETNQNWFLSFALPVTAGFCVIVCTVVTLLYYLKKGVLYILGGALIATGIFMPVVEFLLAITFGLSFSGWSIYPLAVMALFGGLLIYLAINHTAREMMQRKFFI